MSGVQPMPVVTVGSDTLALAAAEVGSVMGTGTDVAIGSAGVTLLGGDGALIGELGRQRPPVADRAAGLTA